MDFVFHLSAYPETLLAQISQALGKRVELSSRRRLPRLWTLTDRLRSGQKAPDPVLNARRRRYRAYGVVLVLMGLFLLIPGLIKPRELPGPLFAGAFALVLGILYLLPRRSNTARFDKTAGQVLSRFQGLAGTTICFSESGITVDGSFLIGYEALEFVLETEDAVLLTWETKPLLLQKKDLSHAAVDDWLVFLNERISPSACFAKVG